MNPTHSKLKGKEKDIKIVKANEKLVKKYWNEKKTWSRNELLEFIRNEVTIDTII